MSRKAETSYEARVEKVARALWDRMREAEDRCDMELEDMGKDHLVWELARIALKADEVPAPR